MYETVLDRALSTLHHFFSVTLNQEGTYLDRKVVAPLKDRWIARRYSKGN